MGLCDFCLGSQGRLMWKANIWAELKMTRKSLEDQGKSALGREICWISSICFFRFPSHPSQLCSLPPKVDLYVLSRTLYNCWLGQMLQPTKQKGFPSPSRSSYTVESPRKIWIIERMVWLFISSDPFSRGHLKLVMSLDLSFSAPVRWPSQMHPFILGSDNCFLSLSHQVCGGNGASKALAPSTALHFVFSLHPANTLSLC